MRKSGQLKYWPHRAYFIFMYSVRREVLYNILIEFEIPKKLVRLIKMCLTETYSRVRGLCFGVCH